MKTKPAIDREQYKRIEEVLASALSFVNFDDALKAARHDPAGNFAVNDTLRQSAEAFLALYCPYDVLVASARWHGYAPPPAEAREYLPRLRACAIRIIKGGSHGEEGAAVSD